MQKRFSLLLLLGLSYCSSSPSVEDQMGIIDSNFTKLSFNTKSSTLQVKFKPSSVIPAEAETNSYTLSFVINDSNTQQDPDFYEYETGFIELKKTTDSPLTFRYNGLSFQNCQDNFCDYLVDRLTNKDGDDITDTTNLLQVDQKDDSWITLNIGVNALHQGETWTIRHGYPGVHYDERELLYPFYREIIKLE